MHASFTLIYHVYLQQWHQHFTASCLNIYCGTNLSFYVCYAWFLRFLSTTQSSQLFSYFIIKLMITCLRMKFWTFKACVIISYMLSWIAFVAHSSLTWEFSSCRWQKISIISYLSFSFWRKFHMKFCHVWWKRAFQGVIKSS